MVIPFSNLTPQDVLSRNRLHGRVSISNGVDTIESDNLVTYHGGDILMQLLAGNSQYKISHVYIVFENTAGTPSALTPARTDTASMLRSVSAPKDMLRTALYVPGTLSSGDVNHVSNRVTFLALANASTGINGLAFSPGSNSKVINLGLVAAPTNAAAGDVLYAHYQLPTPLAVVGSGQVSVTWLQEAI